MLWWPTDTWYCVIQCGCAKRIKSTYRIPIVLGNISNSVATPAKRSVSMPLWIPASSSGGVLATRASRTQGILGPRATLDRAELDKLSIRQSVRYTAQMLWHIPQTKVRRCMQYGKAKNKIKSKSLGGGGRPSGSCTPLPWGPEIRSCIIHVLW